MESAKRANGGGGGDAPGTPAKKKSKGAARVKVVASRYAQALQHKNLESQRARRPAEAPPATSKQQAARVVPSAHALAKQRVSPAAAAASPLAAASELPDSSSNNRDLKERLKAYKASKAPPTHVNATSASAAASTKNTISSNTTTTNPKPVAAKLNTAARDRPGFPKRIGGVERSAKRPAKVASEPTPVETTRPSSASTTPRARAPASLLTTSSAAGGTSTVPQTEQEELELLEALYYQLCFTELRAQQAFRQQEQSAERQILAAWNVCQSKLQLLHDTALRVDREKHAQLVERNLVDQANASAQVASRLPDFITALSSICGSVESSLHRLPTRGVRCEPHELQHLLISLGSGLDGLLHQVQATKLDAKIAGAVTFEQGMEQAVDGMSAALLQVANLVEELLREVNSETSMRIERIQQQRLEMNDWW